jgi:hypothetical protein
MIEHQLGFGESYKPIRIFISKLSGSLWHLWDAQKLEPIAIQHSILTGYIKAIEKRIYASDYGGAEKLVVTIEADRIYEIWTGFNTWFAKSLLIALDELDGQTLRKPITIEPIGNDNAKKVIFARIYTNGQTTPLYPAWKWKDDRGQINEPDLEKLMVHICDKLPSSPFPEIEENPTNFSISEELGLEPEKIPF